MDQPQMPNQSPMGAEKPAVSKWLWITLIIVILIAGGFFAWYYLMGPGKKVATTTSTAIPTTTSTTTTTTTTTSTPTISTIPTGWQTTKNTDYGFNISYPSNWKIVDPTGKIATTNTLYGKYLVFFGFQPTAGAQDNSFIIEVSNKTVDQEIANIKAMQGTAIPPTYKQETITLNGSSAQLLTVTSNTFVSKNYLLNNGTNTFVLQAGHSTPTDSNPNDAIGEQIQTTFQFIK